MHVVQMASTSHLSRTDCSRLKLSRVTEVYKPIVSTLSVCTIAKHHRCLASDIYGIVILSSRDG